LGNVIAVAAGAGHTAAVNAVTHQLTESDAKTCGLSLLDYRSLRLFCIDLRHPSTSFVFKACGSPTMARPGMRIPISALSVGHQIAMAGQDVAISAMLGRIWPDHAPDASQVIVFQCSTGPSAPQMVRGSLWEVSYVLHTCVL